MYKINILKNNTNEQHTFGSYQVTDELHLPAHVTCPWQMTFHQVGLSLVMPSDQPGLSVNVAEKFVHPREHLCSYHILSGKKVQQFVASFL